MMLFFSLFCIIMSIIPLVAGILIYMSKNFTKRLVFYLHGCERVHLWIRDDLGRVYFISDPHKKTNKLPSKEMSLDDISLEDVINDLCREHAPQVKNLVQERILVGKELYVCSRPIPEFSNDAKKNHWIALKEGLDNMKNIKNRCDFEKLLLH